MIQTRASASRRCSDVDRAEDVSVATVARSVTRSGHCIKLIRRLAAETPPLTRGASRHAGDAASRGESAVPCRDAEHVESQGARGQSVSTA